ncbi:DNA-binding NarL/FixJ family response regulator [Kineococcus xinjiangensis]|uniref:DNA-binding NarL/FixJ family response regulator n=1 Tax=Kineococcus xinjiangensis TaxID=512762 RepID=A0A2S6IKA4_9ACTN|nr:response regulator transcription factor [Kineococcus xinjiangensis]PPK94639.1 DNA-binding NarL/FixJ family response regulator [Kineococcus xinjiangensis]
MTGLRVVLVEDHPVYRQGLALLLAEDDITVVAEAGTAAEGLAAVAEHLPDVVVMDVHLPDRSGVQVTRHLSTHHAGVGVLVLTMDSSDDTALAALRAGARGYLLKEAAAETIGRAVAAVARGELLVAAPVAARMAGLLTRSSPGPAGTVLPAGLTVRELEVLDLVSRGLGNCEIARRLFLAEKTVRNNVTALLSKTGVGSRAALVALAHEHRLAGAEPDDG